MDGAVQLILGSHGHVCRGSPEDSYHTLYNDRIMPMITALYKFPRVCMLFHFSGPLLHWIARSHPELILILKDMAARKQIEFLGGGYYDPVFPLIPNADKMGQIEYLTTTLRELFGKRPIGCWLPGFAWEQNLVSPFNTAGMLFSFLDEEQFALAAGRVVPYPCVTEDQGKTFTLFPVTSRYHQDFISGDVKGALNRIKKEMSGGIVTIFPALCGSSANSGTYYHSLFDELSSVEGIELTLPGRIFRNMNAVRTEKLYFPSSGQDETGRITVLPRWALLRYAEANGIYAKMMHTHVQINQLRGDKSRKETARRELWIAQSGDIFLNGKIRHNHIRKAAYKALIEAEKITRDGKGKFTPSVSLHDFDMDGRDECMFQGERLNCYVSRRGAGIFELDYLSRNWNYLDSFTPHGRAAAFVEELQPSGGGAEARDCAAEYYEIADVDRGHDRIAFTLPPNLEKPFGGVRINKIFQLKKDTLKVEYSLAYAAAADLTFITKIELSLGAGHILAPPADSAVLTDTIEIRDQKNSVTLLLKANRSFTYTTEQNTSGGEYQAVMIRPCFPVKLESTVPWALEFTLKITNSVKL